MIQNKTLTRVGSTKTVPVDVRILAATNRNLREEVVACRSRQDFYYRLSAFSLELPPLRQSREDIYFLINNLLDGIRRKYDMPDKCLSGETFSRLLACDWPGNIRELENVLEEREKILISLKIESFCTFCIGRYAKTEADFL